LVARIIFGPRALLHGFMQDLHKFCGEGGQGPVVSRPTTLPDPADVHLDFSYFMTSQSLRIYLNIRDIHLSKSHGFR